MFNDRMCLSNLERQYIAYIIANKAFTLWKRGRGHTPFNFKSVTGDMRRDYRIRSSLSTNNSLNSLSTIYSPNISSLSTNYSLNISSYIRLRGERVRAHVTHELITEIMCSKHVTMIT